MAAARGFVGYRRRAGGAGFTVKPRPHDRALAFEYGSQCKAPALRGISAQIAGECGLQGFAAARVGRPLTACPHAPGLAFRAWVSGWLTAKLSAARPETADEGIVSLKQWTDLERELLDQARVRRVPYKRIARLLGRTVQACQLEAMRRGFTQSGRAPGLRA